MYKMLVMKAALQDCSWYQCKVLFSSSDISDTAKFLTLQRRQDRMDYKEKMVQTWGPFSWKALNRMFPALFLKAMPTIFQNYFK